MTGQHGAYQPLWDAFIGYAAEHHDGACPSEPQCPAGARVLAEHRAAIENEADVTEAVRRMLAWLAGRCADTLLLNARTTSADNRSPVVVTIDGDGTIGQAAAALMTAAITGQTPHAGSELRDLIEACTESPVVAARVTAVLIKQLPASLIVRHQQLGTIGAHP